MSTPDDVRDRQVGDALGTYAGNDEPPYDRLFDRVRHRGRTRQAVRWTTVGTAVAVFVGGVAWAGLSIAAHGRGSPIASSPPSTGSTTPDAIASGWERVAVPGTRLTMRVPPGWHQQKIKGDCTLDPSGLFVADVPPPYGTIATRDGCRWPPGMGRLPTTAVVVGVDHYAGGPGVGPGFPGDGQLQIASPFPLSLSRFAHVQSDRRTSFGFDFSIAGDHRYQAFAWIGNDASPDDRAAARAVIASVAPQPCPAPTPGAYEPSLSPASGRSKRSVFTVSGGVPITSEDGTVTGPSGSIAVFWNVDPGAPDDALTGGRLDDLLAGRAPAPGPGATRFLGMVNVDGACNYDLEFKTPDEPPGTYDVGVFEVGGGGAALIGRLPFTITG